MNAWEAQWLGGNSTSQYSILKMTHLLDKTALINFPMATTVAPVLIYYFSELAHYFWLSFLWMLFMTETRDWVSRGEDHVDKLQMETFFFIQLAFYEEKWHLLLRVGCHSYKLDVLNQMKHKSGLLKVVYDFVFSSQYSEVMAVKF